jgi:sucrose phosphorylase
MANHQSETGRVFQAYRHLLKIRKRQPAFHPDAPQTVLDLANGLFGLLRVARDNSQRIVCLFNCSQDILLVGLDVLPKEIRHWEELIGEVNTEFRGDSLVIPPYAAFWFSSGTQP